MSRWDQAYQNLPTDQRSALDKLVNAIFSDQSGFAGKIDPQTQPQYVRQWLAIRDQVMANREKFADWLKQAAAGAVDFLKAIDVFNLLDRDPTWIRVARAQLGTHEIAGAQHNAKIMNYIRTCSSILKTDAQRKYVEREGEEGVEWCSCFVNWCLRQVGIIGTNDALASSWTSWGDRLSSPKQGAIVGFNWTGGSRIDHVAFCDEVNGSFVMLGGNQTDSKSGGQVSSVPFRQVRAKFYRWPIGQ